MDYSAFAQILPTLYLGLVVQVLWARQASLPGIRLYASVASVSTAAFVIAEAYCVAAMLGSDSMTHFPSPLYQMWHPTVQWDNMVAVFTLFLVGNLAAAMLGLVRIAFASKPKGQ